MAPKNTTTKSTDEIFGELMERMESLRNAPHAREEASPATEAEPEAERGPAAFAVFDSSVFSSWAAAVGDLMASADAQSVDRQTIPICGGLIYQLLQAADELAATELAKMRARA